MTSTVLDPKRIEADYLIETSIDPRVATEIIAGEQSSGTFRAVPRETPQLKERAAAQIEKIEELEAVNAASLLGATRPAKRQSWRREQIRCCQSPSTLAIPHLLWVRSSTSQRLRLYSSASSSEVRLGCAFPEQVLQASTSRGGQAPAVASRKLNESGSSLCHLLLALSTEEPSATSS